MGVVMNDIAQTEVGFCPADKVSFDPREQMAELFVAGFYEWFHYFSRNKAKLAAAFAPGFYLQTFFLAVTPDNQVVAMVGCPDGAPALRLDRAAFIEALGTMRGRLAHKMLTKFLIDTHYPFEVTPDMGSIEFVVSAPAIQGQGITGRLIEYTMQHRRFKKYVLEVAQTNTRAVRLYQRLGFTEKMRKPAPKRSGVGEFLYLERDTQNA